MDIKVEICTTSIVKCMEAVRKIRDSGIPKEHIFLIANKASRDTIVNNYDLRSDDGSFFSSHQLLENITAIITLPAYEEYVLERFAHAPNPDPISDYKERIEFGSIVVAIMEDFHTE